MVEGGVTGLAAGVAVAVRVGEAADGVEADVLETRDELPLEPPDCDLEAT